MIKKFKYLILNLILLCLFLFSITSVSILNAYAYTPITEVDEKELYNQTNTYDISSSCFNEDGSFITINDTNREIKTQYSLQYDFTSKNGNETMEFAQITVLTPGLGSYASTWSNTLKSSGFVFAHNKDSIIAKIDRAVGGANIYWAKVEDNDDDEIEEYTNFSLYDITNQKNNGVAYNTGTGIDTISDISKHIIIVFDPLNPSNSNNNLYYQFNYVLSKIICTCLLIKRLPRQ